jgi:membrane protein YqaA with SNARE-associated domain
LANSHQIQQFGQAGYFGVFVMMILLNATVIVPTPGIVFVFLLGPSLDNPLLLGLVAGGGAALGEITGYIAGYSGRGFVTNTKTYERVHRRLKEWGAWLIFVLALIPNPLFDIAGIAAGTLKMQWWKFLLATGAGKIIRFTVIAWCGISFL